jgi:hypothetical protein
MTRIAWCIRTVCTRAPTDWPKDASECKRVSIDATCCQHLGEAFSTVPHLPKPGYIGQRVNARGVAFATRCILQPFAARQGKGRDSGKVYC